MELNWTTFILEILNFLVLVWLLKHFFYKPVKAAIARRRQDIEEQLQKAAEMRQAAGVLRGQYENRLEDWESERREARIQLAREIEQERLQLLAELQRNLEAERKKSVVLAERQAREQQLQSEFRAMALGARFAAMLLRELASKEMEAKLLELLMVEVQRVPAEPKDELTAMVENEQPVVVQVRSAYPVNDLQKESLQKYLDSLLSYPLAYNFSRDPELIAGLRITVGPWVIHANLHDELKAFCSIAHDT